MPPIRSPEQDAMRRRAWVAAHARGFPHWGSCALAIGILSLIPFWDVLMRMVSNTLLFVHAMTPHAGKRNQPDSGFAFAYYLWTSMAFIAAMSWLIDFCCRKEEPDRPGGRIAMIGMAVLLLPLAALLSEAVWSIIAVNGSMNGPMR